MDPRYFSQSPNNSPVLCPCCHTQLFTSCTLAASRNLLVDFQRAMPPVSFTRLKEKLRRQPDGPSRDRLAARLARHPYYNQPAVDALFIKAYCQVNECECGLSFAIRRTKATTYYSFFCWECGCLQCKVDGDGLCLKCTSYYCPLPNLHHLAQSLSESGPGMSPSREQLLTNFMSGVLQGSPGMVVPDP